MEMHKIIVKGTKKTTAMTDNRKQASFLLVPGGPAVVAMVTCVGLSQSVGFFCVKAKIN